MDKTMKAAVMKGRQEITVDTVPMPQIKPDEVLIQVKAVGVCGSDLHYYEEGKIGEVQVIPPFILGHEVSGQIVQTGSEVRKPAIGRRVAVEAGIPCGTCEFCRSGKYNLCPDVRFLATPPIDGAFAEYLAYPAKWVYPLPDHMTYMEGTLIEPLAVGMHAAEIAGAGLGESAFIFGCGCIGLLTLLVLKSRGVSPIYMCDVIESRMDKARALGAAEVFHGSREDVPAQIMEITGGRGVDYVFEMTGSKFCLKQTPEVIRKGGVVTLVGLGSDSIMDFDFGVLIWKEGQIRTCFRYQNIYPKAIQAISSGIIDVTSVVSHHASLDEVPEAMKLHAAQKSEIIKMVIDL